MAREKLILTGKVTNCIQLKCRITRLDVGSEPLPHIVHLTDMAGGYVGQLRLPDKPRVGPVVLYVKDGEVTP